MNRLAKNILLCSSLLVFFLSQQPRAEVFSSITSLVSGLNASIDIPDKVFRLNKATGGDDEEFKSKRKGRLVGIAAFVIFTAMTTGFIYDRIKEHKDRKERKERDDERRNEEMKSEQKMNLLYETLIGAIHNQEAVKSR